MDQEWMIRGLIEQILESQCPPELACADHPELLPVVLKRLTSIQDVRNQLDVLFPPANSTIDKASRTKGSALTELPDIAGYEVRAVLGRGGMGIVYTARHCKLDRVVAIKMLLAGPYASPQEIARFVQESRAIAGLQHPNIVQVHDVGEFEGLPYFTMEFIDGGSLAESLSGSPKLPRRAAEIALLLANAVQAAHTKGIIHRDLKPANILITSDGVPKIGDFGLARQLEGDSRLTTDGARIGTPSYMAPEQAMGDSALIGTPVDIYSLGAILYEMLTGRPPYIAATAAETQRQVIFLEVVRPSRLNANVPRDLETICMKCLQKDFAKRYATAKDLGDDLQRFLDGRPVVARPAGLTYRLWRWGQRNRATAAATLGITLLLLLLVLGSVSSAAYFHRLEGEQRKLAKEKGLLADQKGQLVVEKEKEREKAVLAEQRESALRHQSEVQGSALRQNLYLSEMNLGAQAASASAGLGRVHELLAHWEDNHPDLRNWEWFYLNGLCHRSLLTRIGHTKGVCQVAFSPNGKRLASGGADRTICIWNDQDDLPALRLSGHTREVFSVAWSPDAAKLASASWDNSVRIWDTRSGKELMRLGGHTAELYAVAWSPDGKLIASGGADKTIVVWNAADGSVLKTFKGHSDVVASVAFHNDSHRLASASHDMTICIWDINAEEPLQKLTGHINWVNQVLWSPDGSRLASASNDQTCRIWDPASAKELLKISGHTKGVTSLSFSQDGNQIATCSDDRTLKVWSSASGVLAFNFRGHTAPISTVAWNPKENRLASAGHDGSVRIWDALVGSEIPTLSGHETAISVLAWSNDDGSYWASGDANGVINIWNTNTRTLHKSMQGDYSCLHSLAWHPANKKIACASENGLIRIWDLESSTEPHVLKAHQGSAFCVAWSSDGRRLISGGLDRNVHIWDSSSGQIIRTIKDHQHSVYAVALSSNGKHLATASGDRTVKIWDIDTGDQLLCYRGHTSEVTAMAWNPAGTLLATGGHDETVHIWNCATGETQVILRGHTSIIANIVWNSDGSRLASAGRDGTVKIWDTTTGHEALNLESATTQANAVAWSPDGMAVMTAAEDHKIRIYDATAGYVAARADSLLDIIDRRLTIDSSRSKDWLLRAEIYARNRSWDRAETNIKEHMLREPRFTWHVFDAFLAGPYPEGAEQRHNLESLDFMTAAVQNDETDSVITWKAVPYSAQGVIDLRSMLDHADHVSTYMMFPIYSIHQQKVSLDLGASDKAVLWLNRQRIFESKFSEEAIPDANSIPLTLNKGWNSLLVQVSNQVDDYALYLRLPER